MVSKIFDWYRDDFDRDSGSVAAFIALYRADGHVLTETTEPLKIQHADYDWSLNRAR